MAGRKKSGGSGGGFNSFIDILTCLAGVMVLIILLVSIETSQMKVLIPTPMEHETAKRRTYLECRNNQLFQIDIATLKNKANEALKNIAARAQGDTARMLQLLAGAEVSDETYNVDLTYALLGQFALFPRPDVEGYALVDITGETENDWLGRILTQIDPEEGMVTFIVRDESYAVFKRARALAWIQGVEASYELLDPRDPIKFGLGGSLSMAQ